MRHIKLKISYEGSRFFGWQKTRTGPSIEESLEDALFTFASVRVKLEAASRTDRGVHARGQIVHFSLEKECDPMRLMRSLNALLPPEISVDAAELTAPDFHPTLDASSKEYHYHLCNQPVQSPLQRHISWHIPQPLDIALMQQAAHDLVGEHDFSAFTNERTDDNVRRVERVHVQSLEEGRLRIELRADRFLYKMARNLAGTLVAIGSGKLRPDCIPSLLASRDRKQAGMTAPAHGLCLMEVFYKDRR